MEEEFGPHLTLDLKKCNQAKISDLSLIFDFLNEFPDKISMTKITQPYVFKYSGLVPEDIGITGNVIIAESHISIHSFQEKGWCFVDIFSCKPFDYKFAVKYIVEYFEAEEHTYDLVKRGIGFPK